MNPFRRRSLFARIKQRVRRFVRAVKRSYDYAVFGWGNPDWDFHYLFALLRFKLERMNKYLNANHLRTAELRSIRAAARLARRLEAEAYTHALDRHFNKHGRVEWFDVKIATPEERKNGIAQTWTRKPLTPELEEVQQAYHQAVAEDTAAEARDRRWLFSIMDKYCEHWWD